MPVTDLGRLDVGNGRTIEKTFYDGDGNPTDPGDVRFRLEAPGLDPATVSFVGEPDTLQRTDVGAYKITLLFDVPGLWFLRWIASVGLTIAEDMVIFIEPSQLQ